MPPINDLTVLVPIDISVARPPPLKILDLLRPFTVVLLGYFPVPDQAEPALLKDEYESEASSRLSELANSRGELKEILVFTHDREATIDRVADENECDAVMTVGEIETETVERVLVPLRGDANLERITSVVADLLRAFDATATFFHSATEDSDPSHGEFLLRGTVDRLSEHGVEPDRIDWQLTEGGDPHADIVGLAAKYDIVVLGETEPSLRERIIGDVQSRVIGGVEIPALIVRDLE